MIHELEPRNFNNAYLSRKAEPEDVFLAHQGDNVLAKEGADRLWYPSLQISPGLSAAQG